jgi:hypothetical protein
MGDGVAAASMEQTGFGDGHRAIGLLLNRACPRKKGDSAMSTRSDITNTPPRLAYSCRCGWLDLGHMNPASHRAHEGAQDLWDQVQKETGARSKKDPGGFKVTYQQTHAKKKLGITLRDGVTRQYWVKAGLAPGLKQSVALAIFKEVSIAFETMQSSWFYRNVAKTDSGFSAEDLVSNLIGFYKAVNPALDVAKICGVVSTTASLDVWDTYGSVGSHKNKTFQPLFFPCTECQCGKPAQGACKTGAYRNGAYRVSIGEDGKIVVKAGDWLSKYSAAMYGGDVTHVNEFGRLVNGKMEPIADVNRIYAGETIYHIPTYDLSKNPAQGPSDPIPWTAPLPDEFRTITPLPKGTFFRDWTMDDEYTAYEQDRMRMLREPKF